MAFLTALTSVSEKMRSVMGNKRVVISDLVFGDGSSNFPLTGVPIYATAFGMGTIEFFGIESDKMNYQYNHSTNKLYAFAPAVSGASVVKFTLASGIPSDSTTLRVMVVGYGIKSGT